MNKWGSGRFVYFIYSISVFEHRCEAWIMVRGSEPTKDVCSVSLWSCCRHCCWGDRNTYRETGTAVSLHCSKITWNAVDDPLCGPTYASPTVPAQGREGSQAHAGQSYVLPLLANLWNIYVLDIAVHIWHFVLSHSQSQWRCYADKNDWPVLDLFGQTAR